MILGEFVLAKSDLKGFCEALCERLGVKTKAKSSTKFDEKSNTKQSQNSHKKAIKNENFEGNSQEILVKNLKNSQKILGKKNSENLCKNLEKNNENLHEFLQKNENSGKNSRKFLSKNKEFLDKNSEFLGENNTFLHENTAQKAKILLLRGDLASGKTTLVKALALANGVKDAVSSPTFAIMHEYQGLCGTIYHYDIYNAGFAGLLEHGLCENLSTQGLHIVEWADERLENYLKNMGLKALKIEILADLTHKNKRKYLIYE